MKKAVKLSMVLVMAVCVVMILGSNVYAALSCNVDMKVAKTEYSKNDEFTVNVDISNIVSERGVISFGATLGYDKDSLELVKMEGQNGWETPVLELSYNPENGIMAITRSGLGKNDETILKITFKVKDNAKEKATVTLSEISVADGTELAKVSSINKEITIKEGTSNPDPIIPTEPDTPNKPTQPDNNNNTTIDNTIGNTTDDIKDGKLPQAGEANFVIISVIAVSVIGAVVLYIRAKKFSDIK